MSVSFDFGSNWLDFSKNKLDERKLLEAKESLAQLIGMEKITNRTFLDIGCGSGIFSIAAADLGASSVLGFDINPIAIETSKKNAAAYLDGKLANSSLSFCIGNILDLGFISNLDEFDVVYAWGSLHHTGSMWKAIENTAKLVKPGEGRLALAIYNHHWTSPFWKKFKYIYNLSTPKVRRFYDVLFGMIIYLAVWIFTGMDPKDKERGMDFQCDVVDWLGGYPYEYASKEQIISFMTDLGFSLERYFKPRMPTGCNEFVFRCEQKKEEEK